MIVTAFIPSDLDLLTSRAFERVARSYERDRTSAERERAKAGSYHTRPENQANDFEKVYLRSFTASLKGCSHLCA